MSIDENILRQLAGNIYWKDLQGRYLGCNEGFAKCVGFENAAQLIGKSDLEIVKNPFHLNEILKADQSVIESGEERTLEEIGIDQNGNIVTFLTKKLPLRDQDNRIIGVIGTSISNNHIDPKNHILRHTTGNVYWKNLQGYYLGCNDSFADMMNLSHPNEIIGKHDRDLFKNILDEESLAALVKLDQEVMSLGIEKLIEEQGVDKKGNFAIYMTKKVPMRDEKNNIIGLIGNSLDVTKQKQAETAKFEFLRNMSHDIMTPFTGIQGISSILYEEETDPIKKEHLKYLIQSSDRLLHLFKQILEVAEFGGQQLKLEEFNLKELITETAEMVSVSANHKGLSLTVSAQDKIIKSDKLRVTRIVLNLLGNAVKFTDTGSIHVEAECEPQLKISVQDSGIGIPADKMEIIFEKFQKLLASGRHRNYMGSGIGLYIAKQFAIELGGDIVVESELGKGSKFTFYSEKYE